MSDETGFCYIWEFRIELRHREEFEKAYGPDGAWVRLFASDPAYLGTDLLRDPTNPGRYLTVDRWKSRYARDDFRRHHREEFDALDQRCEELTANEIPVGNFDVVG